MQGSVGKPSVKFYTLMILALIGVGFSVYLSQHYYEVRSGAASFKSICNVNATMNCDAVAASRYAEVFFGLPISGFATGWYLGIIGVAMMGFTSAWRRVASRVLIAMGAWALFSTLVYLFIMFGVLHTYCLFCLLMDAVNVAIFGVALTLKPIATGTAAPADEEKSAWRTMIGTVVVCLAVAVIATKGMDNSSISSSDIDLYVQSVLSSPTLPASADDRYPTLGAKNAPITVVEFSDFQCPHCQMAAKEFNALLNRYPDKVRVVFRNFPLDPSCNPSMKHELHNVACEAARVAYCANQQGKFKEVYESIFENQSSLVPGKPVELARAAGVDQTKLDACIKAPETQAAILNDIDEALRLQVQSTPTLFINGHKTEGGLPIAVWDRLIPQMTK
jgi:protein-disulfide isomerase/uncharacterized membrane protein